MVSPPGAAERAHVVSRYEAGGRRPGISRKSLKDYGLAVGYLRPRPDLHFFETPPVVTRSPFRDQKTDAHGFSSAKLEAQSGTTGVFQQLIDDLEDVSVVEPGEFSPAAIGVSAGHAKPGGELAVPVEGQNQPVEFEELSSERHLPELVAAQGMGDRPGRSRIAVGRS